MTFAARPALVNIIYHIESNAAPGSGRRYARPGRYAIYLPETSRADVVDRLLGFLCDLVGDTSNTAASALSRALIQFHANYDTSYCTEPNTRV